MYIGEDDIKLKRVITGNLGMRKERGRENGG